jgi:hypothetical protein
MTYRTERREVGRGLGRGLAREDPRSVALLIGLWLDAGIVSCESDGRTGALGFRLARLAFQLNRVFSLISVLDDLGLVRGIGRQPRPYRQLSAILPANAVAAFVPRWF